MKLTAMILVAAFSIALVSSLPVPENEPLRSQALERLVMVEGDNEEALRSKRTIGILRQLFPGISQMIEKKVNAITSEIFRILGPVVLRSALGGGGAGGGRGGSAASAKSSNEGTTVELAPPSGFDDDDDKADDASSSSSNNDNNLSSKNKMSDRLSISLPTSLRDEDDDDATMKTSTSISANTTESSDVNPEAQDRLIEETAESQNNEVRVQFADDQASAGANEAVESELAPLEDIEVSDDENRNKRFLNFGFGASGGAGGAAGSGGSGGGSGNFLFDIIRLVAGSGSSQQGDVAAGAPSPGRGDGTTEAVPGPVTRLFVLANRGISNLLQDLILRLAATSERIVNFKARLITSII